MALRLVCTKHYLVERGAFTFPLDNLTRAFMASFSRCISTLGGVGGPEKDCKVCGSSIRAYVVVGVVLAVVVAVTVAVAVAVAALWASSSSSLGLVRVYVTLVGTPFGYLYLYPWKHSIRVHLFAPNFLLRCQYRIMSFSW